MGLYKKPEDVIHSVKIDQNNGIIDLYFYADCGKHGTDESLSSHSLSVKELLEILQKYEE